MPSEAWAAVILLLFAVADARAQQPNHCMDEAELAQRDLPAPDESDGSDEIVHLRVASVRYAIPRSYFRYPPVGCDTEEGGLLLRVLLPTFQGWLEKNDDETRGALAGPNMGMNILLEVNPAGLNMLRTFSAYARGADPNGSFPHWDGLLQTSNRYGDDVFFAREDGRITFLMVCSTHHSVPYPGCSQHYHHRGAQLRATFRRSNLPEWRLIRDGTVALLDAFVREASDPTTLRARPGRS